MGQEIELKLSLAPDVAAALAAADWRRLADRLPGLSAPQRARRLVSQYFDTPDFWLARHGMALRHRRDGGRLIQTLKAPGDGRDGLQILAEWESEIAADKPELDAIGDAALRRRLRRAQIWPRLVPIFKTRFERIPLDWASEETRVEIALDRGWIEANARREAIGEIELELKAGDWSALYRLAEFLIEEIPARIGGPSKAERGYALYRGERASPQKAKPVLIPAGADAAEAFAAIMRNGLQQLRANEAALLAGDGTAEGMMDEAIHQFRVATRRMRAILGAYRAAIDDSALAMMAIDLRWLQRQFGPARDFDVMIAESLGPIAKTFASRGTLEPLLGIAEAARGEARRQARLALDNPRYSVMVLQIYRYLATGSWRAGDAAGEALAMPAGRFAGNLLKKRHRNLLRLGGRHGDLGEAELHRLRILGKKMRYAAEAFASLYKAKPARRYLAALAAIQDRLGTLNDAYVGRGLLDRLVAELHHKDAKAAALQQGIVLGWQSRRIAEDLRHFSDIWHAFLKAKKFWR